MCLYPVRLKNRKYTVTEKNGGRVPFPPIIGEDSFGNVIFDDRVLTINVPCGNCEECRAAKTREWQVRLTEEIRNWEHPYFVTLTFSPQALADICRKYDIHECNAVAAYAVRHMLELWRKKHKKSLRHWFVTELGHEGTERIHLHGIIFTNEVLEFGEKDDNKMCRWSYWKYGHIYVGDFCTLRTVNYIVKYMNKIDLDHKGFKGVVLASPGIGSGWLDRMRHTPCNYGYRPRNTIDYYTLNTGSRIKLPKYYANHLRNEDERELIWREFMDTEKISIDGVTYRPSDTSKHDLDTILDKAREVNSVMGYGDNSPEWKKIPYNVTKRMLEHQRALDAEKKRAEKFLFDLQN